MNYQGTCRSLVLALQISSVHTFPSQTHLLQGCILQLDDVRAVTGQIFENKEDHNKYAGDADTNRFQAIFEQFMILSGHLFIISGTEPNRINSILYDAV